MYSFFRYKMMVGLLVALTSSIAQPPLPPVLPWNGESEKLIFSADHQWITEAEKTDFRLTATYGQTSAYLKRLSDQSDLMQLISIGKSAEGRDIWMTLVNSDSRFEIADFRNSKKPTLLVQAGIHAGEIDGKDAGLMLLRDIAFGSKSELIKDVNLLFIPILNVDGHERVSRFNRINQRGPENMGWRTNSKNLNLNRDYMKMETEEIQAVIRVINDYNPLLYIDVHVTDGADYQYDITYGYCGQHMYSPNISKLLHEKYRPAVDDALSEKGHIPGPLLFAMNGKDFEDGNTDYTFRPAFSHAYGDLRHLPSILVENHSLKPYKQRVLGTYIFLEASMKALALHEEAFEKAVNEDQELRPKSLAIEWTFPRDDSGQMLPFESMTLKGIKGNRKESDLSGSYFVEWTGNPEDKEIKVYCNNEVKAKVNLPKAYLIPPAYGNVVDKLRAHGIEVDQFKDIEGNQFEQINIRNLAFNQSTFEGHIKFDCEFERRQVEMDIDSTNYIVFTDQKNGLLAAMLLEPESEESLFKWGYFNGIFSRTEYIESYVIEPLAKQMMKEDKNLETAFKNQKFGSEREKLNWFYEQSPYVDDHHMIYPVLRILN